MYTAEDAQALRQVSDLFDGIHAKLLRAAMDAELDHLYQSGFLQISRECYEHLKHVSPASDDVMQVLNLAEVRAASEPGA